MSGLHSLREDFRNNLKKTKVSAKLKQRCRPEKNDDDNKLSLFKK
mgnify:CR=1 FL=1